MPSSSPTKNDETGDRWATWRTVAPQRIITSTAATGVSHSSAGTAGPLCTSWYVYDPSGASAATSSTGSANGLFGSNAGRNGFFSLLSNENALGFCVPMTMTSLPS